MLTELDPIFARVCIWLTFASLCVITVCLPLIVFFLMRLGDVAGEQRRQHRRDHNRIVEELEKLREELAKKRDVGNGP